MKLLLLILGMITLASAAPPVLIVADEFPAMEVLAARLKSGEGIESKIVKQTEMPADLAAFRSVIVYIHQDLREQAEKRFIEYANGGGRLILLHHSISSGKRKNQYWTPFVGVVLPWGEFADGGYRWIDPVTLEIANLAPGDYITSHKIQYDAKVAWKKGECPGFTLANTEVYLNHNFTAPRKILLGLKYADAQSGKTYLQDTAGWVKRAGKGWLVYFMAGHSVAEFQHPIYSQMVLNAVTANLE
jgi:hypothetical protein